MCYRKIEKRPRGLLLLAGLLTGTLTLQGAPVVVGNAGELEAALKSAQPGATIQLAAGEWKDLEISIEADGEAGKPIIIEAEEAGRVRLTGAVEIRLAGQHLVLRGLHFDKAVLPEGGEALVCLRGESGEEAMDCRLTDLYFDRCNPEDPLENYPWIRMYGHRNRVDHCRFEGQDHKGRAIQVRVYEADAAHRIDYNYFLDRLAGAESNGYEVIQVGLSGDSMKAGNVVIERNIFESCDGETEIISSKSWHNIIRENLFLNSSGTVTLRHGRNCEVTGNVFIGEGKEGSGGVRVIDSGHVVRGNYFSGLTGRTGAVLVLYCGIPDSPLSGYFPASDTLVEGNMFTGNTGNSIYLTGGFGARNRVLLPQNVRLEGNTFGRPSAHGVVAIAGSLPDLQLKANRYESGMETGLSPSRGLASMEDGQSVPKPPEVPDRTEVGPGWLVDLPQLMLLDPSRLRNLCHPANKAEQAMREGFLAEADRILEASQLYSVTFNERIAPSGDPHDYYSTGPYWWPNPDTADGLPYIRIDGKFNPERDRVSDREPFTRKVHDTRILSIALVLSGEARYGEQAARLLRTWFLDPGTRMNPNLNHAQAIPGVTDGRGTGIIDTHPLAELVDAISLVGDGNFLSRGESARLDEWLKQFADWMLYSENGIDERQATNNHGTAYDLQLRALLWKTGQKQRLRQYLATVSLPRIGSQIQADGRQPRELARTRTWSYCTENLEHFFKLGLIADSVGIDLLHHVSESGSSLQGALAFLLPYACDSGSWPYEQVTAWQDGYIRNVLYIAREVYPDLPVAEKLDCLPRDDQPATAWLLGGE